MTRLALGLCLLLPAAVFAASDPELTRHLKGVEEHYNRAKSMQLSFEETYHVQGQSGKSESGELYLRKPGRMRWDYKTPAGKLFVSDGKDAYFYTPIGNKAEKMKLKETDDMRAPLAFLLGKLEFEKEFQNLKMTREKGEVVVTAEPKSDRLPYKQVQFNITPQFEISKLDVTGQDGSILGFRFSNEKVNPKLDEKLFTFQLPQGAYYINPIEGER